MSLPAPGDKRAAVQAMFDRISGRYDALNRVLTFGMDVRWRKRATRALGLDTGARVVDLACGTGDFCRMLDAHGYRSIGVDFSFGMLSNARTQAPLLQADALALPIRDGAADGVTCGFALRNVTAIDALFAESARIVRPGGRVAFLEVAEPRSRLARAGHRFYFHRVVPAIGGMFSDRQAYRYLPDSVSYLPEPRALAAMLSSAGFEEVERIEVGAGAAQILTATRR